MRLSATNIGDCPRMHRGIWDARTPSLLTAVGPEVTGENSLISISGCAAHCHIVIHRMYVLRHLTHGYSMGHFTTGLAQGEAAPDVIRRLVLQVGQREIRLAIASIGRAQQRK